MASSSNHIAFTLPINPPSATPRLTRHQVWLGLERKVRHAEEFVPAISACTVLEETTDPETGVPVTIREAVFTEGNKKVKETCKAYEPTKVDFWQPGGSLITNVISEGPGGAEEGDLYMTYVFENRHPELEGKEGEKKSKGEVWEKELTMAKMAVGKSIESIREMVRDGKIKD